MRREWMQKENKKLRNQSNAYDINVENIRDKKGGSNTGQKRERSETIERDKDRIRKERTRKERRKRKGEERRGEEER
jgi:hypothetical protein